jgi:pimeloyl-ACP methyl ester carboxylesterase
MWERQVPALAAAGYRAVTGDLLGHGRSDRPPRPGSSYTMADLADSLMRSLEEADVGRAALAGFSLGGGVALQIALARPDRIGALVLASTSAWMGPGAPALFTERAAAVEARGVEVLVQPAIARWFTPEFVTAHGDAVARYAARIGENRPTGMPRPAARSRPSTCGSGSARCAARRSSSWATVARPRRSPWRRLSQPIRFMLRPDLLEVPSPSRPEAQDADRVRAENALLLILGKERQRHYPLDCAVEVVPGEVGAKHHPVGPDLFDQAR